MHRWPSGWLRSRPDSCPGTSSTKLVVVRLSTDDCFTELPFAGNPTAVLLLDSERPETGWLQSVAAELNPPTAELDLCGGGTLAVAHVLWETGETAAGTGMNRGRGDPAGLADHGGRYASGDHTAAGVVEFSGHERQMAAFTRHASAADDRSWPGWRRELDVQIGGGRPLVVTESRD